VDQREITSVLIAVMLRVSGHIIMQNSDATATTSTTMILDAEHVTSNLTGNDCVMLLSRLKRK
jgi:hypothetical protein